MQPLMRPSALACAYVLDLIIGDPRRLPHPVRLMGRAIAAGQWIVQRHARTPRGELIGGALVTIGVIAASLAGVVMVRRAAARFGPRALWSTDVLLGWTTVATKDLADEAHAVIAALDARDLPLARQRLRRIVGRDTQALDASEITRAVIETVAESTCDGIIAPLGYLAVGGVPAAMAYKAANTLDSMIGHPEPPYTHLGRAAARTDDVASFAGARASAALIAAAAPAGEGSTTRAWAVARRDAHQHRSPNAGHPEAAMAGALGVRLGGTNTYDSRVSRGPVFGEEFPPAAVGDAKRAVRIMRAASLIGCAAAVLIRVAVTSCARSGDTSTSRRASRLPSHVRATSAAGVAASTRARCCSGGRRDCATHDEASLES